MLMPRMERMAVIDMGSNSWRLVVYGYEPGRFWQHVDEIREAVRVSQGMEATGRIQDEPFDRALHTAHVFNSFCQASGIDDVTVLATSAIRDAENGEDLLGAMREDTDFDVQVVSGRDEARYGYLAIANSTTLEDGIGIELGGGSLQLMRIEHRGLADAESWPLGAVRMSEAFLPDGESGGKAMKALRKHVTKKVGDWLDGDDGRAVGIGGTVRNLAAAAERRAGLEGDAQGFVLSRDALDELIDDLASMSVSKRRNVPGIKPDRGDVILGGAVVLSAVMEAGGFDELEVSEAGLREGAFFERFLDDRDPPLFDDVRRASVVNLANRYEDDLHHQEHVAKLSLEMYDGLAGAKLLQPDDQDRDLLWAACMLHDIGTAVDYDDHHKHSQYLILNAGLPGFDPREVGLVALIARYHRKGDPSVDDLGKLAKKRDGERLELLAGIIRLAEQFERSRDRSIGAVELAQSNGKVTLDALTANGDPSVAIWSARRNADLLGAALDREVEIESHTS
jgi:exopolyphosphatase / guanosine-5'-triphosphate,3'-diphosphate pyrophosphatase